jgi:hypothetical protein
MAEPMMIGNNPQLPSQERRPTSQEEVTKVRGTERHIGSENVYMLRFNSLICRSMLSMSEEEQRVTHVRGLKPNVTFEVEKE